MLKAVLWDLDGTLVDSAEFHWQAWRDVMAEEGRPITHDQFVQSFGKRNDLILADWFGAEADPDYTRWLSEEKESRFRALVRAHGIEPLPGVREWVARLHVEGWRHAIATSAPRLNLETMADAMQMRHFFGADVAAEDVTHGKPDPGGLSPGRFAPRRRAAPFDRGRRRPHGHRSRSARGHAHDWRQPDAHPPGRGCLRGHAAGASSGHL